MAEINFPQIIEFETAYLGLLKEELDLCKSLSKKSVSTDEGRLQRVEYLKRAMKVQIEIKSKQEFIARLEQQIRQK
jgi:hypothetical protein